MSTESGFSVSLVLHEMTTSVATSWTEGRGTGRRSTSFMASGRSPTRTVSAWPSTPPVRLGTRGYSRLILNWQLGERIEEEARRYVQCVYITSYKTSKQGSVQDDLNGWLYNIGYS